MKDWADEADSVNETMTEEPPHARDDRRCKGSSDSLVTRDKARPRKITQLERKALHANWQNDQIWKELFDEHTFTKLSEIFGTFDHQKFRQGLLLTKEVSSFRRTYDERGYTHIAICILIAATSGSARRRIRTAKFR